MKKRNLPRFTVLTLVLAALASAPLAKAVTPAITGLGVTTSNQMPGSATDFSLFGTTLQNTNLHDFTVVPNSLVTAPNGGPDYSTITDPAGNSVLTGSFYGNAQLATFTLGTVGSTADFSNFDAYIMFGNDPQPYLDDTAITLTLYSGATQEATYTEPVTDNNTNLSLASYAGFNIVGASTGETLVLSVQDGPNAIVTFAGGASFSGVPEPKVWAMMFMGLGVLVVVRRKRFRLQP